MPDEFLLYPKKLGREFYGGPVGVIWQNRSKQLSSTGHAPVVVEVPRSRWDRSPTDA